MGAWGARKANQVVRNCRRVLAMELLSAAQGIEFLRPLRSSKTVEKIHHLVRKKVAKADVDRSYHDDLIYLENLIASRALEEIVR
jgi:histidine ammonia-lyase